MAKKGFEGNPIFKDIPFSLESLKSETYFIELFPKNEEWLATTKNKRYLTAKKLYECLQPEDEEKKAWGLKLPKIFGLTTGERMLMKDGASRRRAIADYLKLASQIHNETGIPVPELQEMLNSPFEHMNVLAEYIGDISTIMNRLDDTAGNDIDRITNILKERLIPTWDEEDTKALHIDLFEELGYYIDSEQNKWQPLVEEKDEPEVGEAGPNTLAEESENSNLTQNQTGEASTTTSLDGESEQVTADSEKVLVGSQIG